MDILKMFSVGCVMTKMDQNGNVISNEKMFIPLSNVANVSSISVSDSNNNILNDDELIKLFEHKPKQKKRKQNGSFKK